MGLGVLAFSREVWFTVLVNDSEWLDAMYDLVRENETMDKPGTFGLTDKVRDELRAIDRFMGDSTGRPMPYLAKNCAESAIIFLEEILTIIEADIRSAGVLFDHLTHDHKAVWNPAMSLEEVHAMLHADTPET